MLKTAEKNDLPGIGALYRTCFEESQEGTEEFLRMRFRPEDCFLWEEDGAILAMAHAFDMMVETAGGRRIPAAYIYAVATHPQARGRGISTRLLEFLWQERKKRGAQVALLVPAEDSLFDFYGQRGYATVSWIREGILGKDAALRRELDKMETGLSLRELSPQAYLELRDRMLSGTAYARWDLRQISYQRALGLRGAGGLYGFSLDGSQIGCCAVEIYDGTVWAKELLLPGNFVRSGAAELGRSWPSLALGIRMPNTEGEEDPQSMGFACRPFAMARADSRELLEEIRGCYFGLALD